MVPAPYCAVQVGSDNAVVGGLHDGRQERSYPFGVFALRNVLCNPDQTCSCACLRGNRKRSRPDPPDGSVRPDDAIFNLRLGGGGSVLEFADDTLQVLWVDGLDP